MRLLACNAPQCPTGDVTLSTQAEVDQFVADYPNCDKIDGALKIQGNTISDISGLAKITTLKRRLYILNTNISSVDMKIKTCTGLEVINNNLLTSFLLDKFDSSLQKLNFSKNAKLTNIIFEKLQGCRIISIEDNESLKKISLPNSVASDWNSSVYRLQIKNNTSLTSIYLPKIGYIKEELNISENLQLINLDISGVVRGGDSFRIINNPELTSLTLNNAIDLGGTVHDSGYITISDNQKLKSISCTKLQNLVGRTKIANNPNLEIINFKELKSTGRGVVFSPITIQNNPLLNMLDLSKLKYAEGLIIDNTGLKKIDLPELKVISWRINNSNFLIKNNASLTTLNCNKLQTAQDVIINNNPLLSIINLCELNNFPPAHGFRKVHISQNPSLNNLCLDALKDIDDVSFQISNSNLTNINTLQKLNKVKSLTITNNPNLTDCSGLCNILNNNGVTGTITIANNPSECSSQSEVVASCNAPQCPTGDVTLTTQAEVDQFVADYPNCEVIEGGVTISGNDISDISGLSNITEIKGKIFIGSTPNLTNLNLKNLTTAGLGFILSGTGATSASFENLKTVNGNGGPFYVSGNSVLQNLNLPKLESTAGYLIITINPNLLAINLPLFKTHGASDDGYLRITNNKSIQSVNLEKFEYSSDLTISDNISLASINLNNLRGTGGSPSVRGRLKITKSTNLSSLDLGQLISSSRIYIEDTKLTSLNLGKLKSVGEGSLILKNNTKLLQFDLSSLTAVSHISIIENSQLEQISTLENLTTVTGNLIITNNPNLTDCSGLCNVLNNNGVTGAITIENNPSECSSQSEVKASCTSLAVDNELDSNFTVYPNPTHGILTLSADLADAKYTITDIMGRILKKDILKTNTIDITTFKSGVYYLSIVKGNDTLVKTVIKN